MSDTTLLESEANYIAEVLNLASNDALSESFSNALPSYATMCYFGSKPYGELFLWTPFKVHARSIDGLLQQIEKDKQNGDPSICIIENIHPVHIGVLGSALDISPSFFANHARHQDKDQFWEQPIRWSYMSTETNPWESTGQDPVHLDGMFEYDYTENRSVGYPLDATSHPNFFPRDFFTDGTGPFQSNTRISYCRPHPSLYLFLVDAPLAVVRGRRKAIDKELRTTLRLKYSTSRGGILLPQRFDREHYSLYESLRAAFKHSWHTSILFGGTKGVLPGHPMLYMLSSSLWETNLRFLTSQIRKISFRDLRNPKDTTNDELHDHRQDLDYLRTYVIETLKWHPPTLSAYFDVLPKYRNPDLALYIADKSDHPIENLRRILEDAEKLQVFLIDTFQLLMSSLSVRESRLSVEEARLNAEQARRSAWLTQLASVYLPLSVVTGIFGMNLKEISDGPPRWWWAVVVLIVLVGCTVGVYYSLKKLENVMDERKQVLEERKKYMEEEEARKSDVKVGETVVKERRLFRRLWD